VPFFVANLVKFVDGGYVPILIALGFIVMMVVWNKGHTLVVETYAKQFPSFEELLPELDTMLVARVPGTAVYLASLEDHMPPALMHVASRSHTLHEHVILLTVRASDSLPRIPDAERFAATALAAGFYRVVIHVGFSEHAPVQTVLERIAAEQHFPFGPDDVTYFLARLNLLAGSAGEMSRWSEAIYAFLQRNAVTTDRYFGLPPRQVIEIGTQIDL
jgi:KUP system potassium uptake protein